MVRDYIFCVYTLSGDKVIYFERFHSKVGAVRRANELLCLDRNPLPNPYKIFCVSEVEV